MYEMDSPNYGMDVPNYASLYFVCMLVFRTLGGIRRPATSEADESGGSAGAKGW